MNGEVKLKIENFAEIVRRYCIWAESSSGEIEVEIQTAQKILAELNFVVLDLPDVESEDDIKLERISIEQFRVIRDRFRNMPVDIYWTIFDPSKVEDNIAISTELSDDLADIYRDIRYGLILFDAGHFSKALWEWKFSFKIHWGRHLFNAQKVIYSWNFNNSEL